MLVCARRADLSAEEVRGFCRPLIADYKLPELFRIGNERVAAQSERQVRQAGTARTGGRDAACSARELNPRYLSWNIRALDIH